MLDTLDRADENPIAGGWSGLSIRSTDGTLKISSSRARGITASVNNSSYWNTPFDADQECFATAYVSNVLRLYLRLVSPNTTTFSAYECEFNVGTNTLNIRQYLNGSNNLTVFSSTMAALGLPTFASGDRYFVRSSGAQKITLEAFADFGNVGEWTRITQQQQAPSNALSQGGGYIGALVFSQTDGFTEFGGGDVGNPDFMSAPNVLKSIRMVH
jgi:hypothetical protein